MNFLYIRQEMFCHGGIKTCVYVKNYKYGNIESICDIRHSKDLLFSFAYELEKPITSPYSDKWFFLSLLSKFIIIYFSHLIN